MIWLTNVKPLDAALAEEVIRAELDKRHGTINWQAITMIAFEQAEKQEDKHGEVQRHD